MKFYFIYLLHIYVLFLPLLFEMASNDKINRFLGKRLILHAKWLLVLMGQHTPPKLG